MDKEKELTVQLANLTEAHGILKVKHAKLEQQYAELLKRTDAAEKSLADAKKSK